MADKALTPKMRKKFGAKTDCETAPSGIESSKRRVSQKKSGIGSDIQKAITEKEDNILSVFACDEK